MNYKRERLTKTRAVPTIYISPTTNSEVDLLEQPTSWVEVNKKRSLPPSFLRSEKINIDESFASVNTIDDLSIGSPLAKKMKPTEASPPVVRILNGKSSSGADVTVQRLVKKLPVINESTSPTIVQKVAGEHYTIRKISSPIKKPTVSGPNIIKQEVIQASSDNLYYEVNEPNIDLPQEQSPIATKSKIHQTTPSKREPFSEDLKPILMDSLKQIAEIKEMLNEKQSEAAPSTSKDSNDNLSISQSQLNKVQLFNGIKRYLSPSMNALLRIELFSSPGREYKKDEKIICQELLMLGEKTYSFLSDEWRLRLPAKKEVQQWIEEQQTEEDDDAS